MKRGLFIVAAWASGVLCVLTAVMLVRSYWVAERVGFYSPAASQSAVVVTNRGQCILVVHSHSAPLGPRFQFFTEQTPVNVTIGRASSWIPKSGWVWEFAGFGIGSGVMGMVRRHVVTVPLAFIAIVLMPLPIAGVRARRRKMPGQCSKCGYDLRATPDEGGALLDRCPECGTAVKQLA